MDDWQPPLFAENFTFVENCNKAICDISLQLKSSIEKIQYFYHYRKNDNFEMLTEVKTLEKHRYYLTIFTAMCAKQTAKYK